MQRITIYIVNRYRHINLRLDALYRSIGFIFKTVAEETGNIVIPYGHQKKPVTVELPVSIYSNPPDKWSKG